METHVVDARGMACPIPVINTKKALEKIAEGQVTIIVDNDAAKENILSLARGMDYKAMVEQKSNEYYIQIIKTPGCMVIGDNNFKNDVIFISSAELGRGSQELGSLLMKSFLFSVLESEAVPATIIFVNSGVQLTCHDSPVLEHLLEIKKRNVEILACGTCLDYYKLKEKLCVGEITNMYTILEKMNKADKVITI